MPSLRIALVGDPHPDVLAHRAIPVALDAAARVAHCSVSAEWQPTASLAACADVAAALRPFDAVWCVPASPYESMDAALEAIRFARERGRPFLGTCGGFQHALIEYARNVRGLVAADHAESSPDAELALIVPLACSLVGATAPLVIDPDSRLAAWCGGTSRAEQYHCSYGLDARFRAALEDGDLRFVARDDAGEVRAFELRSHPFFVGTLFQPERSSTAERAHPVVEAFVRAASGSA